MQQQYARKRLHSSSPAPAEPRFNSDACEAAFNKIATWDFTPSKVLNQAQLKSSFPVSALFSQSSLAYFLTITFSFDPTLIREFFANLTFDTDRTTLTSRVAHQVVEITKSDLRDLLHISLDGPSAHSFANSPTQNWKSINVFLRNHSLKKHVSDVEGLILDARVVQHVLRHSILPKAGDRTKITPLLTITTFYILTNTCFDVGDLIIRYIENIHSYLDPLVKRKHNLALGHLISFVLHNKYALAIPESSRHSPTPFTNNSFHILYSKTQRGKASRVESSSEEEEGEEEEEEEEEESEDSGSLRSDVTALASKIGRLETSVDRFHKAAEDRWRADEEHRISFEERWQAMEERRLAFEERTDARWTKFDKHFPD